MNAKRGRSTENARHAMTAWQVALRRYVPLVTVLVVVYGGMVLLSAVERRSVTGEDGQTVTRYAWKTPTFLLQRTRDGQVRFHVYNQRKILEQGAINVILGVGMTYVILTGGIDLSVGSVVALASVLFVGTMMEGRGGGAGPVVLAIALGVGAGLACGLVNGALVAYARIPPFIATLGMMMMAKGLAFYVGGREPSYFTCPARLAMWLPLAAAAGAVVIGAVALHVTVVGRHVYAVGGNAVAARLAGIRVARVRLFVYAISGVCAGAASVVLWSRVGTGSYLHGEWYELYAIAAVVIGGTSLFGGEGSVFGTVIGALIIAVLNNGLNVAGIESQSQKIVVGAVIVAAACWDSWRRRHTRVGEV